jgi:tRNA (uracil-5-)-methyltransferase
MNQQHQQNEHSMAIKVHNRINNNYLLYPIKRRTKNNTTKPSGLPRTRAFTFFIRSMFMSLLLTTCCNHHHLHCWNISIVKKATAFSLLPTRTGKSIHTRIYSLTRMNTCTSSLDLNSKKYLPLHHHHNTKTHPRTRTYFSSTSSLFLSSSPSSSTTITTDKHDSNKDNEKQEIFVPRKFQPFPFHYHQQLTLQVESLTNRGIGICRTKIDVDVDDNVGGDVHSSSSHDNSKNANNQESNHHYDNPEDHPPSSSSSSSWVIMVPNVIPGETITCSIYRNHKTYSEADLISIVQPSPHRIVNPPCSFFSTCGGCQYQHMDITTQRIWKKNQVKDLLQRIGGLDVMDTNMDIDNSNGMDNMGIDVRDTVGTNEIYHYRSKITPHYDRPIKSKNDKDEYEIRAIGFKQKTNRNIIDIPYCHIATEAINEKLTHVRNEKFQQARDGELVRPKKGATLLLRDAHQYNQYNMETSHENENNDDVAIVETDPNVYVQTKVKGLTFRFLAGNFFQNNPYMLPVMVDHVVDAAVKVNGHGEKMTHLIDCYCGSGLFCLSSASYFDICVGIEVNEKAVEEATVNADINKVSSIFDIVVAVW